MGTHHTSAGKGLAFELYQEHFPSDGDVKTYLDGLFKNCSLLGICSPLHNRDEREVFINGEVVTQKKKPHYHVLVDIGDTDIKSAKEVLKTISGGSINHFENVQDMGQYFMYLTHETPKAKAEGKALYERKYPYVSDGFELPKAKISKMQIGLALISEYTDSIDPVDFDECDCCAYCLERDPNIGQILCSTVCKAQINKYKAASAHFARHLNNAFKDEKFENKNHKANAEMSAQETPMSQYDAQKIGWKTEIVNYVE